MGQFPESSEVRVWPPPPRVAAVVAHTTLVIGTALSANDAGRRGGKRVEKTALFNIYIYICFESKMLMMWPDAGGTISITGGRVLV